MALATGLFAGLVAACSETVEPVGVLIGVPTQQARSGGETACMAALLTGTLAVDARWGIAVAAPDGAIVKVLWPNGYVGRNIGGVVELLDGNGVVVGRVGDHVEIGGGLGVGDWWYACS
jgi:hypothetical protein